MKKISVREFGKNPQTYYTNLPLELTVYGKVVALLVSPTYRKDLVRSTAKYITKYHSNLPLNSITDIDIEDIATRYNVPVPFVRFQLEALNNYCQATDKRYKDYKAALRNFVLRDIKTMATKNWRQPKYGYTDASQL